MRPTNADLLADEKHRTAIILKPLDTGLPVARFAVQVLVRHILLVEPLPQQAKQCRELREDEDLASVLNELQQSRQEHIELR